MSCSCITPRAGSRIFAKSARILSSSSGDRTVLCLPRYVDAKANTSLSIWRADQCEQMNSCLEYGKREMRSGKDDMPKLLRRNARPRMRGITVTSARSLAMLNTERWDSHNNMVLSHSTGWFRRKGKLRYGKVWKAILSIIVKKKVHTSMCLILNGYQEKHIWIPRPNSVRLLCGVRWRAKVTKEKWIHLINLLARTLDPAYCCPRKEKWRSSQTKNTWYSQTSCKGNEDDSGIFEHLLWTIIFFHLNTKLKLKYN